jgi:hypothetical protein
MSATALGHPAFWSFGLSLTFVLHHFRSIGMARPYLTFTSSSTTTSEFHTCAPQAKRHVAQPKVPKLNPSRKSCWQSLITNLNHKSTYQPCALQSPLLVSTPTNDSREKSTKEEEKTKSSPKWPKAKEKPKLGHLKWTKLGPQRHGQRLDATK